MTIAEVSRQFDITPDTLRYYERIGLIPPVPRTRGGLRDYGEESCGWIEMMKCMRKAGVQIEALIEYVTLFRQGDDTADARKAILDEIMLKAIPQPREDVSDWAPKMTTMHINPDKIREVIGKGGSVIQNIVAESGAKVDIEDDGTVTIAAVKATDADKAKKMIEAIVKEPEPGEIYYGKVVRLMNFGAFVNLLPGKDGMVHISKMADHRIEKVEDAVKEGDMVWVKVMEIDDKGRVNLSMKDVKPEEKIL